MIHSHQSLQTYFNLLALKKLMDDWRKWRPDLGRRPEHRFHTAIEILVGYRHGVQDIAMGIDETAYADFKRGWICEEVWFMQCALRELRPSYMGQIWSFIEDESRTHQDFIDLLALSLELALSEVSLDQCREIKV